MCNESGIMLDMLYDVAQQVPDCAQYDLKPQGMAAAIDELNAFVYKSVNNAVYRCGALSHMRACPPSAVIAFLPSCMDKEHQLQHALRCACGGYHADEQRKKVVALLLKRSTLHDEHKSVTQSCAACPAPSLMQVRLCNRAGSVR